MTSDSKKKGLFDSLFGKKEGKREGEAGKAGGATDVNLPSKGERPDLQGLMERIGLAQRGEGGPAEKPAGTTAPPETPLAGRETPGQFPQAAEAPPPAERGGEVEREGRPVRPPTFAPAKKSTEPSGKEPRKEQGKGTEKDPVISVEDIDDLSGLILPKGATFTIDEIRLPPKSDIFKFKGTGDLAGAKDLGKADLLDTGIKKVTEAASEVQAEQGVGSILAKLNPLNVIHRPPVEYNPRTHGPLVDLTFRPRPGVELIEGYPVNEPYAYVRITYDNATHEYFYEVLEPKLTPAENALFLDIKERIFERLDINTQNVADEIAKKTLRGVPDEIIREYGITLIPFQREKILYAMY
ncbi:MAG: hypothetical protein QXL43_03475 [Methanolinea sp.]